MTLPFPEFPLSSFSTNSITKHPIVLIWYLQLSLALLHVSDYFCLFYILNTSQICALPLIHHYSFYSEHSILSHFCNHFPTDISAYRIDLSFQTRCQIIDRLIFLKKKLIASFVCFKIFTGVMLVKDQVQMPYHGTGGLTLNVSAIPSEKFDITLHLCFVITIFSDVLNICTYHTWCNAFMYVIPTWM